MAHPRNGGQALKRRLSAGVDCLAQNVERINQLNVFPVPDGDTGVNLYHTLRRAWEEIAELESDDLSVIAERFAYGALMGARGNSGTILSQLLTGFADGLGQGARLDPPAIRPGLRGGGDAGVCRRVAADRGHDPDGGARSGGELAARRDMEAARCERCCKP